MEPWDLENESDVQELMEIYDQQQRMLLISSHRVRHSLDCCISLRVSAHLHFSRLCFLTQSSILRLSSLLSASCVTRLIQSVYGSTICS